MTEPLEMSSRGGRVLDPIDRNSEVLFGLFMVLTFTGTLSAATAGREEVRTMLIAAVGCNIAWGFVDAVMYVLRSLVVRGRQEALRRAVRAAGTAEHAHRLIADELDSLAQGLGTQGLELVRQWVVGQPPSEAGPVRPTGRELRGSLGVFLLVVASTFPPVLPFVFLTDLHVAMRASGGIAIVMLFLCGYNWGRYAGARPVRVGVVMVLMGVIVQAVVIALGG
jgi:VIT1/CCC1 family predicted Fe2+/Mn2+ transporter